MRGIKGAAAAIYFREIGSTVLAGSRGTPFAAQFQGRHRRPATDPLNAALSFAYGLLARQCTLALATAGLDPRQGFLHAVRAGRPALALDLMEPLRPLVPDRAVFAAIGLGELTPDQFEIRDGEARLHPIGRRRLIGAFERRLADMIDHPAVGRPIFWRAVPGVQARLMGDWLTGVRPDFPQPRPR